MGEDAATMLQDGPEQRWGSPNEAVTHWGIERLERGKWARCEHPARTGVLEREWPLAELTLETVRERWRSGRFRATWVANDPDNPDPKERRRSMGKGPEVAILPEAEPAAVIPSPTPGAASSLTEALQIAQTFMALGEASAARQLNAAATLAGVRPPTAETDSSQIAELKATTARLEARLEADAKAREVEDRHRAELSRRDAEIRELRREIDDDRRGGDGPLLRPGSGSIVEQIGYAIANGVARIASEKPEIVAKVFEAIQRKPSQPPPPALQQIHPPPARPAPPAPPPPPPQAPVAPASASASNDDGDPWPMSPMSSPAPSPAPSTSGANGAIPIVPLGARRGPPVDAGAAGAPGGAP